MWKNYKLRIKFSNLLSKAGFCFTMKFDIIAGIVISAGEENEGFFDNHPNSSTPDTFALLFAYAFGDATSELLELVLV